jgi:DNA-binding LytR/AlgR family response regulator
VIQAGGTGGAVRIVPIDDVLYFEAADKYVRVITAGDEHLIRLSLRELLPRLDAARFWQIHRGTVVRIGAVTQALRDEAGRVTLQLAERPERLSVSRLYAHRFKPQ